MMENNIKKPEILSPAGNFEKLRFASLYGADAVYFALDMFGMRAMTDNFKKDELVGAVEHLHSLSKKAYVTLNTMPRSQELHLLEEYLEVINEAKPDAVIVADLGVFTLARQKLENIDIHISTQGANMNYLSCRAWHDMGASRIVLARELSLDDIALIRAKTPRELELEVFVHGAMCVSVSGRCLLSEYYTGRDANRGACAQPCRWVYNFAEEKRPEDVLTAEIQPEGTYIFGSKDMNMIAHIPELVSAGIDSFKIEGRMKSAYYTAVTTNAYRMALDAYFNNTLDEDLVSSLENELLSVSHREYCTGYFFSHVKDEPNLASRVGYEREKAFLATVEEYNPQTRRALCRQRNKTVCGDMVEALTPNSVGRAFQINCMYNDKGESIDSAPHAQMLFEIDTPFEMKKGDILRASKIAI